MSSIAEKILVSRCMLIPHDRDWDLRTDKNLPKCGWFSGKIEKKVVSGGLNISSGLKTQFMDSNFTHIHLTNLAGDGHRKF